MVLYIPWIITVLIAIALFFDFEVTLNRTIPVSLLATTEKKTKERKKG